MEKDKSIALQKQVRDNAEDLKSEFLDMKNWEEQMTKADLELRDIAVDQGQVLPPVRKKKSSSRPKLKTKENGSKAKKVKSFDYSAWDHFDADKACEELDKESDSEDSGEEVLSKEELEKNHEEASKHKVMGNTFVKEQKWDKAMACYNEAIKIFPYDAVFYANRALCHLKMENLYSAEADCTSAIQRDEYYIKAYHRRATARMALKQYKEAVQDLKKLLSLEPTNKEAKKILYTATKHLENLKPVIISSTEDAEEVLPVKEIIIEKTSSVPVVEVSQEVAKENKIEEEPELPMQTLKLPEWLPVIADDVDVVKPITKSPHQRVKTPLKFIPITSTDFITASTSSKSNAKERGQHTAAKSLEDIHKNKKTKHAIEETIPDIPPVPKTSVQFLLTWRKCKAPEFRYKYLKQLPAESIPKLFQDSMETDTFSEILSILTSQFLPEKDGVFNYLKYLSEIKRFRTLTMFLGKKEKEDLNALLDFCKTVEGQPDDTIIEIRNKYEI